MLQSKARLQELNSRLADILVSKGVTATADETTTALIEKVNSISGGEDTGVGSRQWWDEVHRDKAYYTNLFIGCNTIKELPSMYSSKCTQFVNMCLGCISLQIVNYIDTSNGVNFSGMFNSCTSLITIISELDVGKSKDFTNMFGNCGKLTNISFVPECIKISISFAQSPLLSDESIQSIIDGLATVSIEQRLTFHSTVYNKLTSEQLNQIEQKGWAVQ